jgi:hypothetical protein
MRPKEAQRFQKSKRKKTNAKLPYSLKTMYQSRAKFKAPVASKASLVLEGEALSQGGIYFDRHVNCV